MKNIFRKGLAIVLCLMLLVPYASFADTTGTDTVTEEANPAGTGEEAQPATAEDTAPAEAAPAAAPSEEETDLAAPYDADLGGWTTEAYTPDSTNSSKRFTGIPAFASGYSVSKTKVYDVNNSGIYTEVIPVGTQVGNDPDLNTKIEVLFKVGDNVEPGKHELRLVVAYKSGKDIAKSYYKLTYTVEPVNKVITYMVDGEIYARRSYRVDNYLKEIDNPEKPGHEFIGWFSEENGQGTSYTEGDSVPRKSKTLYAYFRDESTPKEQYVVRFNPSFYGHIKEAEQDFALNYSYSKFVNAGEPIEAPEVHELNKDKHPFMYWALSDDPTHAEYDLTQPVTHDVNLIAIYKDGVHREEVNNPNYTGLILDRFYIDLDPADGYGFDFSLNKPGRSNFKIEPQEINGVKFEHEVVETHDDGSPKKIHVFFSGRATKSFIDKIVLSYTNPDTQAEEKGGELIVFAQPSVRTALDYKDGKVANYKEIQDGINSPHTSVEREKDLGDNKAFVTTQSNVNKQSWQEVADALDMKPESYPEYLTFLGWKDEEGNEYSKLRDYIPRYQLTLSAMFDYKYVSEAPTDVVAIRDKDNNNVVVTGKGVPGSTVKIVYGDTTFEVEVDKDGNFKKEIPLTEGVETVTVITKEPNKKDSTGVSVNIVDKGKKPSPATEVTAENTDKNTEVKGKTDPNTVVVVTDKNGNKIGEGTSDEKGNFTIVIDKQKVGDNIFVTPINGDVEGDKTPVTVTNKDKDKDKEKDADKVKLVDPGVVDIEKGSTFDPNSLIDKIGIPEELKDKVKIVTANGQPIDTSKTGKFQTTLIIKYPDGSERMFVLTYNIVDPSSNNKEGLPSTGSTQNVLFMAIASLMLAAGSAFVLKSKKN